MFALLKIVIVRLHIECSFLPITAFTLSLAVPVFGFAPLFYLEVEGIRSAQVIIVEVNNLQFGNGVSRTLTINSRTTGQETPAVGKPWWKCIENWQAEYQMQLVLTLWKG